MPLACICGGFEFLLIIPAFVLIRKVIRWIFGCKICDCKCHNGDKDGK